MSVFPHKGLGAHCLRWPNKKQKRYATDIHANKHSLIADAMEHQEK